MKRTKTQYCREGLIIARDYERCLSVKCHHVSNDKYYGQPFLLEPWQRENMWKPIFACGEMSNEGFVRRYRRAIFGLPSGFGKTELAAGITLTVATMEPIYNGQYGVVASTKDQVQNIFSKIATMIKLDDDMNEQWEIGKEIITHKETNAKIMVLPNKAAALESWHFNVLIFDELHVYKDDKVWNAGIKGQKVLHNPLAIGITTAGEAREGFLWELLKKAENDTGMYLYWLGLNDSDNINHKRVWQKLMVASWVTWETIQDQKNSASSEQAFERYAANRFPSSKTSLSCFKAQQLDRLMRTSNKIDFSQPYTLGIDGATSGDTFAIVAYQRREDGVYTKEWVFDEPDEKTGHYRLTEIEELIAEINKETPAQYICIDPNRMILLSNHLEDNYGLEITQFAQNNPIMCQATSLVYDIVKSRQLHLKNCPKLREHLANTVADDKGAYGTRFGKNADGDKIDAAIALALAALGFEKLVSTEYIPFN